MKVIAKSCCARVGLMGNPSDGFGGKTVSFLIDNFKAKVTITEHDAADGIVLQECLVFAGPTSLVQQSSNVVGCPSADIE